MGFLSKLFGKKKDDGVVNIKAPIDEGIEE